MISARGADFCFNDADLRMTLRLTGAIFFVELCTFRSPCAAYTEEIELVTAKTNKLKVINILRKIGPNASVRN